MVRSSEELLEIHRAEVAMNAWLKIRSMASAKTFIASAPQFGVCRRVAVRGDLFTGRFDATVIRSILYST